MSGCEYFYFERLADASGVVEDALLEVADGVIVRVSSTPRSKLPLAARVFEGFCAWPGLINLHEHLACSVYSDPHVSAPEGRSREWVLRRYGVPARVLRPLIPLLLAEKYLLPHLLPLGVSSDLTNLLRIDRWPGLQTPNLYHYNAWRNLLSGVTCVLDHSPYNPELPLRLLRDKYTLHGMRWQSAQMKLLLALNSKRRLPIYIHLGDGSVEETAADWRRLLDAGALREDVRLVHGLSLDRNQIAACRDAGMRLVWCPVCSERMFGRLADVRSMFELGLPLALASDAMDTGSFSLLEEMAQAMRLYRRDFGGELSPRLVFEMATSVPADWHADEVRLGRFAPGCRADFFAVRSNADDPYALLPGLKTVEVAAVWRDARPLLMHESLCGKSPESLGMRKVRREGEIFRLAALPAGSPEKAERAWKKLGLPPLWEDF